jgi:hypothetical protein
MQKPPLDPDVADMAPTASVLSGYDEQHLVTYLRLLDAAAEGPIGKRSPASCCTLIRSASQIGRGAPGKPTSLGRAGYRARLPASHPWRRAALSASQDSPGDTGPVPRGRSRKMLPSMHEVVQADLEIDIRGDGANHLVTRDRTNMLRLNGTSQLADGNGEGPKYRREPGPIWRKYHEFSALVSQLDMVEAKAEKGLCEPRPEDLDKLWRKRVVLAKEIVDVAAPTIDEAIFKARMTTSLLSGGEVQVVLTPQCLKDCDRVLSADGDGEQCIKALEPDLWAACSRVRERMSEAAEEAEALGVGWWRDLEDLVRAIADQEAMTQAGLRAKGQIFEELLAFASAMDGLKALQMSYLRDFGYLAYRRMYGKDTPTPHHPTA